MIMRYWGVLLFLFLFNSVGAQKLDHDLHNIHVTWGLIKNFYVDSVNSSELASKAIKAMLTQLDPHSIYLSASEVKAANESLSGNFEGVGIEFIISKEALLVLSVIEDGPSYAAGILPGDRIISINGITISTSGLINKDVVKMLRGRKGTKINLEIVRNEEENILNIVVTCDKIHIHSIEASYMADTDIGYIKIGRFSSDTGKEFDRAIKTLTKSGMKNLILDLRGNSGGFMSAALSVLDHFLTKGMLMVYTEGANYSRHNHIATSKGKMHKGGLIILIDEYSASASEIVAGAIQDWDRGLIVGRRSYGKGLVQRPFSFKDGSEVRLTVAKYYTPSGRSIQKEYTQDIESYKNELISRAHTGELVNKDSIHILNTSKFSTLIKNRAVYGGGGIIPDLFVGLDTLRYPAFYRELLSRGVINNASIDFFNKNRELLLREFKNFDQFQNGFKVNQATINELFFEAYEQDIKFSKKEAIKIQPIIETQIKAFIARSIWGNTEYYRVLNHNVESYLKALQIFKNEKDIAHLLQ